MKKIYGLILLVGISLTVLGCENGQNRKDAQQSVETNGSSEQEGQNEVAQQPPEGNEASEEEGNHEVEPEPSNQPDKPTYLDNPQYIDESLYKGEELEIVKVLNKMMKSTLTGDVEGYKSVLTKDNYEQSNTEDYLKRFKITYLSDPTFYNGPSEYTSDMEVGVKEEIYHPTANIHYFGTVLYLMFKEDGEWKIGERKG